MNKDHKNNAQNVHHCCNKVWVIEDRYLHNVFILCMGIRCMHTHRCGWAYNYQQPLLWSTIIVHSIPTFIDLSGLGVLKDTVSGFDVCIRYTQYKYFYNTMYMWPSMHGKIHHFGLRVNELYTSLHSLFHALENHGWIMPIHRSMHEMWL